MNWYLIDAEDQSFCTVYCKNILQLPANRNKPIADREEVSFFCEGKKWNGIVIDSNDDRKILDSKMEKLAKERSKEIAKVKSMRAANTMVPANSKRRMNVDTFYGNGTKAPAASNPKAKKPESVKMSEEEASRQRILKLNKAQANRQANQAILSKTSKSKKPDDSAWVPSEEDESMDSEIFDQVAHNNNARRERSNVLGKLMQDVSDSENDDQNGSPPASPSKEELKKQLEMMREQLKEKGIKANSPSEAGDSEGTSPEKAQKNRSEKKVLSDNDGSFNEDSKCDDPEESEVKRRKKEKADDLNINIDEILSKAEEDYSNLQHQLYGPSEETKELCYGIYIKKDDLNSALTVSTNVNHMFRRLMVGVFNPAEIMSCTVTGQSWHAGGEDQRNLKHEALHPKALQAIVDFSNIVAKKKKWPRKGMDKAKNVFSVKLTEIKKDFKKKQGEKN